MRRTRGLGRREILAAVTTLLSATAACSQTAIDDQDDEIGLAPSTWPETEQSHYWSLAARTPETPVAGVGTQGMVAGTSGPVAVHAGRKALEAGGSAADAAIATALAQIALHAGGATSFAGNMQVFYFEATSGEVHMLDASYARVLEEEDPLTIPPYGTPSGRAVLVPGFMAGIGALHERFGFLPLAQLLEPAIDIAENGFELSESFAQYMQQRKHVLTRLPGGREIFTKRDGKLYGTGEVFRQPQLARTLRCVASEGIAYMYTGDWGEKLVAAVQNEGGKLTMTDLERYQAIWTPARHTRFREYDVYASTNTLEALNVVEEADLRGIGDYHDSSEALYQLIRISRLGEILGPPIAGAPVPAELIERYLPGIDLTLDGRTGKSNAGQIWSAMRQPAFEDLEAQARTIATHGAESVTNLIKDFTSRDRVREHTAGVVAVDANGNMAAMSHSVSSAIWGEVGIFVDGVSVVDAGAFTQNLLAALQPGEKWYHRVDPEGCPAIALKDGTPVFGCSSIGTSWFEYGLQAIVNVLEYRMTVARSAAAPHFRRNWPPNMPLRQPIGPGQFSRSVLEAVKARGLDIEAVEDPAQASQGGAWVAVAVDPTTGAKTGIGRGSNGLWEGY